MVDVIAGPPKETNTVNVFAIIVLIAAIAVAIFLIICSIYFYNLINLKPPSKSTSTFLFWTAVIMALIFIAIVVYSLVKIFTHKATLIYNIKTLTPTTTKSTVKVETKPLTQPIQITTSPSNLSTTLSDIPLTQTDKIQLDKLLQEEAGALVG